MGSEGEGEAPRGSRGTAVAKRNGMELSNILRYTKRSITNINPSGLHFKFTYYYLRGSTMLLYGRTTWY